MDGLRSEAFSYLKPFCVQLTKDHTRTNIAELFTALQSVDVILLQDLQEYVIFPLRVILKHPKKCSQDLYLDLFTCMEYVLGHTKVTTWDLFYDVFNTATGMLSCPTDQSRVAKLTEELKIAIIQTVRTLVKNAECSVVQQLYTMLCLPLLGHAVSLLLNIAEVEKARNLRILAMECLLDLSQADSKYSQCLKADIGSIYASFLPGVSVTLCKIITGDTKQGYAVTSKAIYVWMRIVSLVMDDKLLDVYRQKQAKQELNHKDLDPRLQGLVVARDSKWVTTTGGNLAILVKQVATVRSHTSWRVRQGLVESAEHLLLHCTSSMKDCVPTFLEILVSLIGDDYSKVASGSRHALELFSQSQATDQQRHLTEILEENLHKLATSLPRQIQTAEEEDKLSLLNLLSGYLSLLGSKVKSLLLSLPHIKRLSLALVQILELECTDIKIVEERTTITGHGSSVISETNCHGIVRPRKYFKHFNNEKIFQKVQGVCQLLGYYGDIHLLVDHFLDIFHESSMFKMQATLIINEMMLGTTGKDICTNNHENGKNWHRHTRDELKTVVRMLVDEYLNPANFDLVTSVSFTRDGVQSLEKQLQNMAVTNTSQKSEITAAKMNRNILQISLYIEGLGNFAKALQIDFMPILMDVMYPLLEKLGDQTAYISNTAFIALLDICNCCSYGSIDDLICDSSDYLMNAISLRLRRFNLNKKCPLVLKVMLQYCTAELLPLIDDTIQEILESLDDNHEEEAVLFMGVLNELAKAVVRWFPQTTDGSKPGDEKANTQTSLSKDSGQKKRNDATVVGNKKSNETVTNSDNVNKKCSSDAGSTKVTDGQMDSKYSDADCIPSRVSKFETVDNGSTFTEQLKEYFTELLKLECEATGEIMEEDLENFRPDLNESGQYDDTEEEVDVKKPVPRHVLAVKEVMLRCKHLVSSRNPRLRLLVLDTMGCVCRALHSHQDELLPLIHQVWPSFSLCFADDEKFVTIKALEILQIVAACSGDFVKQRVNKDVVPKLSNFLHSQAEISIHAGSAYQFTVNYKLQLAILKNIATIAAMTCMDGSDLDLATNCCLPYLNCKQPSVLQQACYECCRHLIQIDADLMWLKLCNLYCPKSYILPDNRFKQIKAFSQCSPNNPYTTNVKRLMTENKLI